jgi:hypothetical protein
MISRPAAGVNDAGAPATRVLPGPEDALDPWGYTRLPAHQLGSRDPDMPGTQGYRGTQKSPGPKDAWSLGALKTSYPAISQRGRIQFGGYRIRITRMQERYVFGMHADYRNPATTETVASLNPRTRPMLRNSASGPEIDLPVSARKPDVRPASTIRRSMDVATTHVAAI